MRLTALLTLLPLLAAPVSGQEEATFSSGIQVVNILATVRDHSEQFVRNLTKDDFQLFDKGRRQGHRKLLGDPGARKKFQLSMGERPLCRLIRKPAHPAAAK